MKYRIPHASKLHALYQALVLKMTRYSILVLTTAWIGELYPLTFERRSNRIWVLHHIVRHSIEVRNSAFLIGVKSDSLLQLILLSAVLC